MAPLGRHAAVFICGAGELEYTYNCSLLVPREIGNLAKVFIKSRARTALKIVSVSVAALKCIRPRHLPAAAKPPSLAGRLQY